jgi:hypothetical protein
MVYRQRGANVQGFLLTIVRGGKTRGWHDFVTLDKSWFDYIASHKLTLLLHVRKVPDRERVTLQFKKGTRQLRFQYELWKWPETLPRAHFMS